MPTPIASFPRTAEGEALAWEFVNANTYTDTLGCRHQVSLTWESSRIDAYGPNSQAR